MEVSVLVSSLGIIPSAITVWFLFLDRLSSRKNAIRKDYMFVRSVLGRDKKSGEYHPYVIEKGYQAIAGSNLVKGDEIKYLLSLDNAETLIKNFVAARDCV